MIIDVYIGLANDPNFRWENGDFNGNIPHRISPFFLEAHKMFYDFCEVGHDFLGMHFVQLDWGAWGAKARKADIEQVIATYGSNDEIDAFFNIMDEDIEYALIICEGV
jgi:hypothetical protein